VKSTSYEAPHYAVSHTQRHCHIIGYASIFLCSFYFIMKEKYKIGGNWEISFPENNVKSKDLYWSFLCVENL
jgi:hypothetical protein